MTRRVNIQEILVRLERVRSSGDGWMARCPAHADRNPSLSIHEHGGKILLHCFANCTTEAICAALNIEMGDLFSEQRSAGRTEPYIVRKLEKKIAPLRNGVTRLDRDRAVTIVLADGGNVDAAIARALSLAVEGELVQLACKEERDV